MKELYKFNILAVQFSSCRYIRTGIMTSKGRGFLVLTDILSPSYGIV